MLFKGLSLFRLTEDIEIKPFTSSDVALNDFLMHDAKAYAHEFLATTYIIETEERTLAYFSVLNDSFRIEDLELTSKNAKKKWLQKTLPHPKRHLIHFPAMKIGRLAVCERAAGAGLGTDVMGWIKNFALESNKHSACKFITVDAYNTSRVFYEKMDFSYFSEMDAGKFSRKMYFPLTPTARFTFNRFASK